MAVWFLSNQEVFRSIANLFGMPSKCTARYCIMQVCQAMAEKLRPIYIRWPDEEDYKTISSDFEQISGFPNVIGCIDGTHIAIKPPASDRDSYINRKGFPSINVLAVCDNRMKFTEVFADRAGSVHDARVLRVSTLGNMIEQNGLGDAKYHILGDSAYPLMPQLIVPYRDNGHLTATQTRFNTVHSQTRSLIERAFARLKGKLRRLRGLECTHVRNSLTIIEAAFVLHNFIIIHEDSEYNDDITADDDDGSDTNNTQVFGSSGAVRQIACAKRDQIAATFH